MGDFRFLRTSTFSLESSNLFFTNSLTNIMGNCGSSSGAAGFRQVEKKLAGHSSTPGRKPEKTVVFGSQFGMYWLHIQKAAPGKVSSGAAGSKLVEKKLARHSSAPGRKPEKTVV